MREQFSSLMLMGEHLWVILLVEINRKYDVKNEYNVILAVIYRSNHGNVINYATNNSMMSDGNNARNDMKVTIYLKQLVNLK